MEPYYAMLDMRIFRSHEFLELSIDAQSRFVKLIGTSDRMGVADLYHVWNSDGIKAAVMKSLYESKLVWEVNPYYCFLPSIFSANRKIRSGKYKANFDVKGFQACAERYPDILISMDENEKMYVAAKGIIMPIGVQLLPNGSTDPIKQLPAETVLNPEDTISLGGEVIDRKYYAKYQIICMEADDFNRKHGAIVLNQNEILEWFMDKYHHDFRLDGKPINDLSAVFQHYCEQVFENKYTQGRLIPIGAEA